MVRTVHATVMSTAERLKPHVSNSRSASLKAGKFQPFGSCRQITFPELKGWKMSSFNLVLLVKGRFYRVHGHYILPLCFLPISSSSPLTSAPFFSSLSSEYSSSFQASIPGGQPEAGTSHRIRKLLEWAHTRLIEQAHTLYIYTPSLVS